MPFRLMSPLPVAGTLAAALLLAPLAAATAQPAARAPSSAPAAGAGPSGGPQRVGDFGSWTAATHTEAAGKVCYAFARASRSEGGGSRQTVLLTVTHRPQGRDQVSASLGYPMRREAEVTATVASARGDTRLPFFGADSTAFAQRGPAAVAAFRNGREVTVRGPGPQPAGSGRAAATTDVFPLAGFSGAYEAITRECPPARPAAGQTRR